MGTRSEQLYREFLDHYRLDQGLFNHAELLSRTTFKKIDTLQIVSFEKTKVPVSDAVKNSAAFRNQLHLAKAFAGRSIEENIRGYQTFRMDEEDIYMLCDRLEEGALNRLLWPFHLLTVESELEEKDFYPLANEMEAIVCDFLDLESRFYHAFMAGEGRIQQQTQAEIEEKNRQTRTWAANAPVEVRGSARVLGGRLHIDATVRSTVTQGQIAADYQVNELLANQMANRKRTEQQKYLLDDLKQGLLQVVDRYIPAWYDCLENKLGLMAGKCVITNTVIGKTINFQPHVKEKMKQLIRLITDQDSFEKLDYLLRYYDYDFDDLYGESLATRIINDYAKEKKINEDFVLYRFYCHFYGINHPVEHPLLFKRIKERIQSQVRNRCETHYQLDKQSYMNSICEQKMGAFFRLIDAIPGLTNKQHRTLSNACFYIFYDVMGNTSTRDIYDEEKGIPVFDFSED